LNERINETLFNVGRSALGEDAYKGMTEDQAKWYAQEVYNNPYDDHVGLSRTIVDLDPTMGEDWSPYDAFTLGGGGMPGGGGMGLGGAPLWSSAGDAARRYGPMAYPAGRPIWDAVKGGNGDNGDSTSGEDVPGMPGGDDSGQYATAKGLAASRTKRRLR
jgi:hypothetical protein